MNKERKEFEKLSNQEKHLKIRCSPVCAKIIISILSKKDYKVFSDIAKDNKCDNTTQYYNWGNILIDYGYIDKDQDNNLFVLDYLYLEKKEDGSLQVPKKSVTPQYKKIAKSQEMKKYIKNHREKFIVFANPKTLLSEVFSKKNLTEMGSLKGLENEDKKKLKRKIRKLIK